MEWIEVTGRTIEEARERALDELGVHESELEYEVVEQPKPGLFGRIGRVEARIRARVKPISRDKPTDRRRRRGGPEGRGGRGGREGSGGRGGRTGPRTGRRDGPRPSESAGSDVEPDSLAGGGRPDAAGTGATGGSSRRRRSRSRPRPEGAGQQPRGHVQNGDQTNEDDERSRRGKGEVVEETTVPIEEQAAAAAEFVRGLVGAFGLGATVEATLGEDAIEVDVEGDDLGLLVGPKGATLGAMEELVRAAVSRSAGGYGARVHLDVAGYRRRRREALTAFVTGLAEEVRAGGVAKAMEPMSASDRKVVHDTVAEIDGVATVSEGEDLRRHVVIRPS